MKIFTTLMLAAALAACGGKSKPDTTPTTTEVAATGGIELGEITMFDGDEAMLKIHADGTTEVGGRSGELKPGPDGKMSSDSLPIVFKPGPTIKPDGSIEFQGEAVARINADGTIVGLKGKTETLPIVVTADKVTVTEGGKQMGFELAADGKVTVFGSDKQPDKPIRVEGADTPGKRRLVLAFTSMMFLRMDPEPTPASQGSATPAVAPTP
jgi:hypothetical protein